MTLQSQSRTTNRNLAVLVVAIFGPILLMAVSAWIAAHFQLLNHPAFIIPILAIATGIGGFLFSKSLKNWPTLESLSILYWFAMPIALAATSFIIYVYISGDGP
jgi:hypothetical protein